jgi:hypothetical protein
MGAGRGGCGPRSHACHHQRRADGDGLQNIATILDHDILPATIKDTMEQDPRVNVNIAAPSPTPCGTLLAQGKTPMNSAHG